jgi:hypothetical protein
MQNTVTKKTVMLVGLLIFVGTLYIASIGPAWALAKTGRISTSAFQSIYSPLTGLEKHCPGDLLKRYENWWAPSGIYEIN